VIMCGPRLGASASRIVCNAGGMARPEPGDGRRPKRPETHSRVTLSPESTVRIGGIDASNMPLRVVDGLGWTW
jgi:hypothetical protein